MADILNLCPASGGDNFPDPNKWVDVYTFNGYWSGYTVAEAHKYVLVVAASGIAQYEAGVINFTASSGTVVLNAHCGGKMVPGYNNFAGRVFMVKDTKANMRIDVSRSASVFGIGEYSVYVQD